MALRTVRGSTHDAVEPARGGGVIIQGELLEVDEVLTAPAKATWTLRVHQTYPERTAILKGWFVA